MRWGFLLQFWMVSGEQGYLVTRGNLQPTLLPAESQATWDLCCRLHPVIASGMDLQVAFKTLLRRVARKTETQPHSKNLTVPERPLDTLNECAQVGMSHKTCLCKEAGEPCRFAKAGGVEAVMGFTKMTGCDYSGYVFLGLLSICYPFL